jgi:hypothetical protein
MEDNHNHNHIDWRKFITLLAELAVVGEFVVDVIALILAYL